MRALDTKPAPFGRYSANRARGADPATALRPGWTARLIPARANGQPALGFYARDPDTGSFYTVGLMVLTLSGTQISAMTRFDPGTLPRFGLPATLGD